MWWLLNVVANITVKCVIVSDVLLYSSRSRPVAMAQWLTVQALEWIRSKVKGKEDLWPSTLFIPMASTVPSVRSCLSNALRQTSFYAVIHWYDVFPGLYDVSCQIHVVGLRPWFPFPMQSLFLSSLFTFTYNSSDHKWNIFENIRGTEFLYFVWIRHCHYVVQLLLNRCRFVAAM